MGRSTTRSSASSRGSSSDTTPRWTRGWRIWRGGSVELRKETAEPRDVPARAVEREGHGHRLADDAAPLDHADEAAVVAVVAVVTHHVIPSLGDDQRLDL